MFESYEEQLRQRLADLVIAAQKIGMKTYQITQQLRAKADEVEKVALDNWPRRQ